MKRIVAWLDWWGQMFNWNVPPPTGSPPKLFRRN